MYQKSLQQMLRNRQEIIKAKKRYHSIKNRQEPFKTNQVLSLAKQYGNTKAGQQAIKTYLQRNHNKKDPTLEKQTNTILTKNSSAVNEAYADEMYVNLLAVVKSMENDNKDQYSNATENARAMLFGVAPHTSFYRNKQQQIAQQSNDNDENLLGSHEEINTELVNSVPVRQTDVLDQQVNDLSDDDVDYLSQDDDDLLDELDDNDVSYMIFDEMDEDAMDDLINRDDNQSFNDDINVDIVIPPSDMLNDHDEDNDIELPTIGNEPDLDPSLKTRTSDIIHLADKDVTDYAEIEKLAIYRYDTMQLGGMQNPPMRNHSVLVYNNNGDARLIHYHPNDNSYQIGAQRSLDDMDDQGLGNDLKQHFSNPASGKITGHDQQDAVTTLTNYINGNKYDETTEYMPVVEGQWTNCLTADNDKQGPGNDNMPQPAAFSVAAMPSNARDFKPPINNIQNVTPTNYDPNTLQQNISGEYEEGYDDYDDENDDINMSTMGMGNSGTDPIVTPPPQLPPNDQLLDDDAQQNQSTTENRSVQAGLFLLGEDQFYLVADSEPNTEEWEQIYEWAAGMPFFGRVSVLWPDQQGNIIAQNFQGDKQGMNEYRYVEKREKNPDRSGDNKEKWRNVKLTEDDLAKELFHIDDGKIPKGITAVKKKDFEKMLGKNKKAYRAPDWKENDNKREAQILAAQNLAEMERMGHAKGDLESISPSKLVEDVQEVLDSDDFNAAVEDCCSDFEVNLIDRKRAKSGINTKDKAGDNISEKVATITFQYVDKNGKTHTVSLERYDNLETGDAKVYIVPEWLKDEILERAPKMIGRSMHALLKDKKEIYLDAVDSDNHPAYQALKAQCDITGNAAYHSKSLKEVATDLPNAPDNSQQQLDNTTDSSSASGEVEQVNKMQTMQDINQYTGSKSSQPTLGEHNVDDNMENIQQENFVFTIAGAMGMDGADDPYNWVTGYTAGYDQLQNAMKQQSINKDDDDFDLDIHQSINSTL